MYAHRVYAERAAQALFRKRIGDHRECARAQRRFADPDTHACGRQRNETARHTAERGGHTPDEHADRNDVAATEAIREHTHRQAENRIHQRERDALEQADLGIGDMQVLLQRTDQESEDLPVGVRQGVAEHQHEYRVPRDPAGRIPLPCIARSAHPPSCPKHLTRTGTVTLGRAEGLYLCL